MTATRTTKVPDGRGGWTVLEGEVLPGATANLDKQAAARQQQFIEESAEITELLLRYDMQLLRDKALTKEHRAFAAALYCVNLRETYPGADEKTADPAAFDVIAKMAADYYDANVPKDKK